MKYLKLILNENEYNTFKNSDEYVEPHVVVLKENTTNPIICKSKSWGGY